MHNIKLFKPTSSVIKVCEETEKCFQRMLAVTDGQLPHARGIPDAFVVAVLASLSIPSLFTELDSHLFDSPVGENHVVQLIKSIIKSYCKVKFYHLGKNTTENSSGQKIRKKLNKLVLFNHQ